MNESAGEKLWKRRAQTALGNRRSDFHFSHSFNNNKLDDRNHFLQNAKTSVASLRRLITPTRNADHDQPGTLIIFIGMRIGCSKRLGEYPTTLTQTNTLLRVAGDAVRMVSPHRPNYIH